MSFVEHVILAATILSGLSLALCLLALAVFVAFKLYGNARDRLLFAILLGNLLFSVAGIFSLSVYRNDPGFDSNGSRCFVYAISDAAHLVVVVFELMFAVELGLLMHRATGLSTLAQRVTFVFGTLLTIANFVWLQTRCVQLGGAVWHVDFNHIQSVQYWIFTALVLLNMLVCVGVALQTFLRFRVWRRQMTDAAVNGHDFASRRITLVDMEVQSAKEKLAPLLVLPISFVVFSVVFAVDAVGLLQHDSPSWRRVGVVCFMVTCLRGALFFAAAFAHRDMRARLHLPALWARIKKRCTRRKKVKMAAKLTLVHELSEPLLQTNDDGPQIFRKSDF